MNSQTSKSVCEHEWEEYDDPAAYNDGFNSPVVAICTKCGAERDIRQKYADINKMKWSETILFLPVFLLITIYLTTIAPIIILISGIKDEFSSKRKAG